MRAYESRVMRNLALGSSGFAGITSRFQLLRYS